MLAEARPERLPAGVADAAGEPLADAQPPLAVAVARIEGVAEALTQPVGVGAAEALDVSLALAPA